MNHATRNYPFLLERKNVKCIPHFHDELELVYVIDGSLNVTIENNNVLLHKDEICVIIPGLIHNLYSHEDNVIFVAKLFPIEDISDIRLCNVVVSLKSSNYEPLRELIFEMMNENKNQSIGYKLSVNISAEKIFLLIIRNMEYRRLEDVAQPKLLKPNEILSSVELFLEQHYAEDFLLEDLVKYLGYTKSYFCHYFKQTTGVTFWKYYTIFRLEKSIQLMKDYPDKRYIEIAGECGFKNIRSFNEAFKKYHQCTPREYMKKHFKLQG